MNLKKTNVPMKLNLLRNHQLERRVCAFEPDEMLHRP
jgi:hypothetical protein